MGLPIINLSLLPVFPANVEGNLPIVVTKAGLTYTFSFNPWAYSYDPAPVQAQTQLLALDTVTNTVSRVDVDAIQDGLAILSTQISDSTATGRTILTGDDAAGRTALGLGALATKSVVDLTADVTGALPVSSGGTGRTSATAYGLIFGGATTSNPHQSLGTGSAGQILVSAGAGALPAWQTPAGTIGVLTNIGFAASVNASALTITLTGAAGSTPSAGSAVSIPFRSATAATGTITQRLVTAATTLVISSGSTMGFANSTAGRIWIVAFDDAGTVRLGAINCRNGLDIFRLGQFGVASSTAEGGAGAADNAHVFYTGTAVTSKAYTVLGYFEWTTGLATAGTWSSGPDRVEAFKPGTKLPGDIVQTLTATNSTYGTNSANAIPTDDTIPQNTEGSQISVTASLTPGSPANVLKVATAGSAGSSFAGNSIVGVSICRSDQSNAIVAAPCAIYAANLAQQVACEAFQLIGTTSAFTVSNRYGPTTTSYTASINGTTARLYGTAQTFWLSAMEIVA